MNNIHPLWHVIDAQNLAQAIWPLMEDYSLESVARRISPEEAPRYRALADAILVGKLWRVLESETDKLSFPVLAQAARLTEQIRHPLYSLFEACLVEKQKDGKWFGHGQSPEDLLSVMPESVVKGQLDAEVRRGPGLKATEGYFRDGGVMSSALPGYESRPEQAAMASFVRDTFQNGGTLLVEAGTGVGKSLAYLIPAILWSLEIGKKVVVSTNTKNLQAQLYEKDIPFVRDGLGLPVRAALLKGRGNYLCLRKFFQAVRHPESDLNGEDEMLSALCLLAWLGMTHTGDVSENSGFMNSPGKWRVQELVCSSSEDCPGQGCYLKTPCFLQRARNSAQRADVVVVNHALLLSAGSGEDSFLPPHCSVVLDEAHNLEDVATRAFSIRRGRAELTRLLSPLEHHVHRSTRPGGALPGIARQLETAGHSATAESKAFLTALIRSAEEDVSIVQQTGEDFCDSLASLIRRGGQDSEDCRIPSGCGATSAGRNALAAAGRHCDAVDALRGRVSGMIDFLKDHQGLAHLIGEYATRLQGIAARLQAYSDEFKQCLAWQDETKVCWVERSRWRNKDSFSLSCAPLSLADIMKERFYGPYRCVVMSSATLSLNGDFSFILNRLGLDPASERLRTASFGSPFDFARQVRALVPSSAPDPDGDGYPVALQDAISEAVQAARGRSLALFTSYRLLNQTYEALRGELDNRGLWILGQGRDGSTRTLLRIFQRTPGTVLLGTSSFWEGVDVPGEALSCLIVTRLPFHAQNEPVYQARCEAMVRLGKDSFRDYTLPLAVLRFRQGIGRLIRRRTDRGVIVVADKRILTRNYGSIFRKAMPVQWRGCRARGDLGEQIAGFLDGREEDSDA
ncbi:MAG TPA: helicase C-terminal domain-containing protein [Candidatus Brocadiia bacterium]|nr:helicase C-terminal domain-containing protein [Candidatus Brocadiia bacterium]